MKLIEPSVEFCCEVPTDYDKALRFIELAGRTCYKSEGKIEPGSAEVFVRKLIDAGHLAMVEHSNLVARIKRSECYVDFEEVVYGAGKYLTATFDDDFIYVGGNLTAWKNSCWLHFMFYPFVETYGHLFGILKPGVHDGKWEICPNDEIPKELRRYVVKFICSRIVTHELVRHRPCSFAQESQRYVKYENGEMEFIRPDGFASWTEPAKLAFLEDCVNTERMYGTLRQEGLPPQRARNVLSNAVKTEIVTTADPAEWQHIKNLRTAPGADPEMQKVMGMVPWENIL